VNDHTTHQKHNKSSHQNLKTTCLYHRGKRNLLLYFNLFVPMLRNEFHYLMCLLYSAESLNYILSQFFHHGCWRTFMVDACIGVASFFGCELRSICANALLSTIIISDLSLTHSDVGLLVALLPLIYVLLSILGSSLADRWSPKRLLD